MNDKELDEYIKKVKPNFESNIEKGTIKMSLEYYNLLEERMARLINENQQLQQKEENLIKYLKHKIKIYENRVMEHGFDDDIIRLNTYLDILERVKSGKYE